MDSSIWNFRFNGIKYELYATLSSYVLNKLDGDPILHPIYFQNEKFTLEYVPYLDSYLILEPSLDFLSKNEVIGNERPYFVCDYEIDDDIIYLYPNKEKTKEYQRMVKL